MAKYFGSLSLHLLFTAAVVAGLWWAAPRLIGERAPAGLLGAARRKLPLADRDRKLD